MAAPTLISHNSSAYNTTTTPKTVTPTSGWNASDVIVVVAVNEGASVSDTFGTPTASGLSFTVPINHAPNSNCGLLVAYAVAASNGSGAISVTQGATNSQWGCSAFVFRGSAGIGNNASQFTATPTVSLTPTGADSAIVWAVGDWAAAAVQTVTPTPTTAEQALRDGTHFTVYVDELTDQTSAGAVSYGLSTANTGPFSIGVIEVKASAGGGATTAPKAQCSAGGVTWTWPI